jgi:hypothetical protein
MNRADGHVQMAIVLAATSMTTLRTLSVPPAPGDEAAGLCHQHLPALASIDCERFANSNVTSHASEVFAFHLIDHLASSGMSYFSLLGLSL